jgi:hypothetical protein
MNRAEYLLILLLLILSFSFSRVGTAGEAVVSAPEPTATEELLEEIRDGFTARVELLGFGLIQKPINSLLNPNNIQGIPRYQTELDFRPNFNLTFRQLEMGLKPRLEVKWRKWDEGPEKGSKGDVDAYIQEGFTRYRPVDSLILSYGRENLQWGPSYLFSPSNPFNRDNGRNNPYLEVPALDYARILWLPTDQWTVSFIANTTKGRDRLIRNFKRGYAIKVDYSAGGKYLTFIPSYREDGEFNFGFFGGWTVTDAFLLHTEGTIGHGTDETVILVGGSYTFEIGPTITAEYVRNQNGCDREPFRLCFPPFGTGEPSDILFRKNYLLLQYSHTRIMDTMDIGVRWIRSLDDDSNRIVNILQYDVGKSARLFAVANAFPARKNTEFGSFLDYSVMLGVSFIF